MNEKKVEKIQYLFKERMLILFYPDYKIIKMLISSMKYTQEKKIINLTFIFKDAKFFNKYCEDFEEYSSNDIILKLIDIHIFEKPKQ